MSTRSDMRQRYEENRLYCYIYCGGCLRVAGLSTGCPHDFEAAGHPVAKVKSFTQYFDMATLLKQIGAFKS